jgi:NAD+ kinase
MRVEPGTPVVRAGFVVHSGRPAAVDAARFAARLLHERGVQLVLLRRDADELDLGVDVTAVDRGAFVADTDVVLSFGGDGTFLRAAHRCRDAGVPVLGVNLGRVGFLAEVEVPLLEPAIERLVSGEHTIEPRATIEAVVHDAAGIEIARAWALNDVAVEKTARQRVLLMELDIAGQTFASVPADAIVLATATGSTAYALSAGGPILSPRVPATLVTPVAPHSLFDRTVVCAPDEDVRVRVLPDQEPAVLSVDGRDPIGVPAGGDVTVRGDGRPVRLLRVDPPHFYELVRRKFSLR